ncbi:SlyX family protein [Microvirga lenta]|uniref:SlyX family protein n=1 Tax=Microvirga lenta TaxID=2881337 RepID=UPI001D00039D|nr:SlyX family protein [Microvirga lenta]MCB5176148.1 SlyX family protein [Microvirga lenta]
MSDDETLNERIDRLEIRIAYQDEIIEDLNKTVLAQWKQIDLLTRRIAALTDRIQEAEHKAGGPSAPEPPPPHY